MDFSPRVVLVRILQVVPRDLFWDDHSHQSQLGDMLLIQIQPLPTWITLQHTHHPRVPSEQPHAVDYVVPYQIANTSHANVLLRLWKFAIHHKGPQISYAAKFVLDRCPHRCLEGILVSRHVRTCGCVSRCEDECEW